MRGNTLDIYVTELCNLNCEYCYVKIKKKEINGIKVNEFIKKIDLLKYDSIKFLGGEPLLKWKEVKQIIEFVKLRKNTQFIIITNGILLDEEKLKFLKENKVSLGISTHVDFIRKLKNRDFISLLYRYKDILGFILLFRSGKEVVTTKLFLFLYKLGFKTFSFAPVSNDNWGNIDGLQNQLNIIKNYIRKDLGINISESNWIKIKDLYSPNFCEKNQVDKKGDKKLCTRFESEEFLSDKSNIYFIKKIFNNINNCNTCNDRWFCVCPIGFYLDNFGNSLIFNKQIIKNFHKLNKVFINFYKDIVKIKNQYNFLTSGINEIRFNLTNQCNLRCNYCYIDFNNNKLDENIGKNIIDYFLEQEGLEKTISFFGGEPLLEFKLLKILVEYSIFKGKKLGKQINFKIATNLLLVNKNIIDFLKFNNFEIHISLNGDKELNDLTRDNSSDKLLEKINFLKKQKYDFKKIIILLVIFPDYIKDLQKNINFIKSLGFKKVNFEMYLGSKYIWNNNKFMELKLQFESIFRDNILSGLEIVNLSKNNIKYLDISTSGKVNSNSLEFFRNIDFTPKKVLDNIFLNYK